MSSVDSVLPRYSLLRHTGAPNDPSGCHYDLLLEDGESCRTWRLGEIPTADGSSQNATALPAHRLVWLEPRSAAVSNNRGWAERVMAGCYEGKLPQDPSNPVEIQLVEGDLRGRLRISNGNCCLLRT